MMVACQVGFFADYGASFARPMGRMSRVRTSRACVQDCDDCRDLPLTDMTVVVAYRQTIAHHLTHIRRERHELEARFDASPAGSDVIRP